jgi:membrane dipeptidase
MDTDRRDFIKRAGLFSAGLSLGLPGISEVSFSSTSLQAGKGPKDFMIVMGHYDIWEFNARFATRNKTQNSPLRDFLLPRLLEGGVTVVVMPPCGDSMDQRMGSGEILEGSMRTIDMLLNEIAKTNGRASLILTKNDVPVKPDPNHVRFFFDMEGAETIQPNSEPNEYYPGCEMAVLRNFFRLGVRGLQLTHNARNMAADGVDEGKLAGKLSTFGVRLVQECNRLGIMVGTSHLSANGIFHAAEVSTKPIVSTHQNPQKFINTDLQHSDAEIKAIASTGGTVGFRYHSNKSTPYPFLADIVDYVADLVGIDHIALGWLGHDVGNPDPDYVPGISKEPFPGTEIEKMTKYEQNSRFIDILYQRKYTDEDVAKVMGGNLLRVMKETLPE